VEFEGAALRVRGPLDTATLDAELSVEGEIADLAAPLAALPASLAELPARACGRATFTAHLVRAAGKMRAAVSARAEGVSLVARVGDRLLVADDVAWQVHAQLGDGPRLAGVRGTVQVGEAVLLGHPARQVELRVESEGKTLRFHASGRGEGWELQALEGHATGLLELASAKPPPIAVEASARGEGRLPAPVVAMLAAKGVDVERLGAIAAAGRVTARMDPAGWRWEATLAEAEATLAPGRLTLPAAGASLRGVAARLKLAGAATAQKATLELLPGSTLAAGEAAVNREEATLALAKGDGAAAALSVAERAALTVTLGEGAADWQVAAPDLRLELRRGRGAAPATGAAVGGLAASVRARLAVDASKTTLDLLAGSSLSVGSVSPGGGGLRLAKAAPKQALAVASLGEAAALCFDYGGTAGSWQARAADVRVVLAPVGVAMPAAGVAAGGLAADARLRVAAGGEKARVDLLAGSRVVVDSLSTHGTSLRVAKADAAAPLLVAAVGKGGVRATLSLGSDRLDWHAVAESLTATLAKANVATVDQALGLAGVAGSLTVRAEGRPGELSLAPLGDWALAFDTLTAKAGGETIAVGGVQLALASPEGRPLAQATFGGDELGLRCAAQVRSRGPVALSLAHGGKATLAAVRATAEASSDPEGVAVAGELVIEGIATDIRRALADVALAATTKGGSLRVAVDGRSPGRELAALPLEAAFELATGESTVAAKGSFGRVEARLASAKLSGSAALEQGRAPAVEARVAFEDATVASPAHKLLVSGLSADVPVTLGSASRPQGTFRVEALRRGATTLPGLAGTLSVADWRADFSARWPLLEQAVLEAAGHVDVASGVPVGEVRARVPRFELHDEKELARLVAEAEGIDLSGAFALDARLELLAERIVPRVTLKADGVTVGSKRYNAKVEGLSAEVVVDRFEPVATPSHQRVAVKRAELGGLVVEDGVVDFRVESPSSIFIESTAWGWAGGRLYTYALRFDPSKPVRLVVYGDKLDLGKILAQVPEQRATGKGTVYGRLPVTVTWGERPELRFGNGFLYATPGEKGWVRVKDAAVLASSLGGGAGGSIVDTIRRRFEAALGDFEYDVFKTDFVREEEQLVARVFLRGRGPEMVVTTRRPTLLGRLMGQKPQPVTLRQEFAGLVFNIPYFDEILTQAIIVKTGVERGALGSPGP